MKNELAISTVLLLFMIIVLIATGISIGIFIINQNVVYRTVFVLNAIDPIMEKVHGIDQCIYERGQDGEPGTFHFCQEHGRRIPNPKGYESCQVLSNKAKGWYINYVLEESEK